MHSVRVGRVFGIELRIDWSIVVIFWLLTWDIASAALPAIAPHYAVGEYWVAATLAAATFLITLLAHEMSHSVVARRQGIEVRDITLWLLGGVARIEGEASTPRNDLAIAVAGPAASLTIGVAAMLLAGALAVASGPAIIVASIFWIGLINVVLALFNLAPAAPLDGGRILRAWLWHRTGDRTAAAVKATHAGRVFAWLLMSVGFAEFALGGQVGGLWLIVLGWFVLGAARGEERQETLQHDLLGVRVRDVMTSHPHTVPETLTIDALVDAFVSSSRGSAFPLLDAHGRVSGLVTLTRCKAVPVDRRPQMRAREIAVPISQVQTAAPGELVVDVLRRGTTAERRVLVFEDDELVGIMTPNDIMRVVQRAELRAGAHPRAA